MRLRRSCVLGPLAIASLLGFGACKRQPAGESGAGATASAARAAAAPASATPATPEPAGGSVGAAAVVAPAPPASESAAPPSAARYPWLQGANAPQVEGTLTSRIAPPPGYTRVPVEPGSFSAYVRDLPLAPKGTPVTSYEGKEVRPGDDEYVEAVVAVDVGAADLQQSADVIVRLHAEWLWARGEKERISYIASSKVALPLSRWEKGQRLISDNGTDVFWAIQGKPKDVDYAEFRRYLDAVFNWGNSTSLSARAKKLENPEELLPGDFFLHSHPPGHVAIVLDVAEKPGGERVALLGQALNPAQSLHILRPGRATPWFSLRPPSPIVTPYTSQFTWSELRRLEADRAEEAAADNGGRAGGT